MDHGRVPAADRAPGFRIFGLRIHGLGERRAMKRYRNEQLAIARRQIGWDLEGRTFDEWLMNKLA